MTPREFESLKISARRAIDRARFLLRDVNNNPERAAYFMKRERKAVEHLFRLIERLNPDTPNE